jgi:sulfoxide reductase heme-binding subunit YedZ
MQANKAFNLAWFANRHLSWIKIAVFLLSLGPAFWLLSGYLSDNLGVNPLQTLIATSGRWGVVFLLLSLTITPLRRLLNRRMIERQAPFGKRLSDWNWIIKLRRMLGLFCFFYAALHLFFYAWLDQAWDWRGIVFDAQDRPFILIGLAAFALLLPLAVTSNRWSIRQLKKNWLHLHKTVYLITALVVIHEWMQAKVGDWTPLPYSIIAALLLFYRLAVRMNWTKILHGDTGMEVEERKRAAPGSGQRLV